MKNKTYGKSIMREILSSKARFLSIMSIIFLGVTIYLGIKSTGPDLKYSIDEFFRVQNLMDSKIVSSIGLNDNDLKLLENNDKISSYEAVRNMDVNLTNESSVVKFMEYNSNTNMNRFVVVDGRLPENSGEIALDELALKLNNDLKIGDTYTVESDESLDDYLGRKTFKIVGFVQSPMYIGNISRGATNVGKGSIDYFAVVNGSDIVMDLYTELYVRFNNVEDVVSYSDEYEDKMSENTEYLENLYSERVIERIEEIKLDAMKEINKAYKEIEDGEKELKDAQKKIDEGKTTLADGRKQYNNALIQYNKEIKDAEAKLAEGELALNNGQKELDSKREELLNGESLLEAAKTDLEKAKNEFLTQGINPDTDKATIEGNINNLKTLISTYSLVSEDINKTVLETNAGDDIPSVKIQYWKAIIFDANLGLSEFGNLINGVEQNPSDVSMASSISQGIDKKIMGLNIALKPLETLFDGINQYQDGVNVYNEQVAKIAQGKIVIEEAQKVLDKSKIDIKNGKVELEKGKVTGKLELDMAKKELDNGERELNEGQKEIDENREKLNDGRNEIDAEKEKLSELDDSKYYYFDRTDNPEYENYRSSIESLDKIAVVFPVFFFLVAALICLTTMTRMVEEKRIEIGTLKALGYTDFEVSKKFIIYAMTASLVGCLVGIIGGSILIPNVIGITYASTFTIPGINIYYYPVFIIQSVIASMVCTVGAALFVLREELKDKPSNLMRAKAPKVGKKILLERIKPLWSRLRFNQKVTFRNLFRYKQRMLMTVLGVAGCMALLVTGLALNESNSSFASIQFDKLTSYDAIVTFNEDSTEEDDLAYNETMKYLGFDNINIYQDNVTFDKAGVNKQTATMYVAEDCGKLGEYVLLNDRVTGEIYKLSDNGVMITEKLAKLLDASAGDSIVLKDANNNEHTVKVDKIIENYTGHYVYMSPNYYKEIFDNEPTYNSQLLKFNDNVEEDELASNLMKNDKVVNVTFMSAIRDMSASADLGLVVVVVIAASGGLAFVVLYNLININVSERIREISTIKVLGFHNREVDMYIFRENIILTILGILSGTVLGKVLYLFIIGTAEIDSMMMIPTINPSCYIISGLITMIFAILVMIMMHGRLKNINMIDALKSVE